MSFCSSLWVPITMSTLPSASAASVVPTCCCERKRDSSAILTGQSAKRSVKVLKCCSAKSVVGTSTATCLPSLTAMNAARSATSVLPKPTSPQISRSIGFPCCRGGGPGGAGAGRGGRVSGRPAAIAADQVQLRHRHVELVAARVFERQEFGRAFPKIEILQTQVTADAVLLVHHRVADLDLRQVAQHSFAGGLALRLARPAIAPLRRIQLGFGDQREPARGQHEPGGERRNSEHERRLAREELTKTCARGGGAGVLAGRIAQGF